jgi:hypothetical protein
MGESGRGRSQPLLLSDCHRLSTQGVTRQTRGDEAESPGQAVGGARVGKQAALTRALRTEHGHAARHSPLVYVCVCVARPQIWAPRDRELTPDVDIVAPGKPQGRRGGGAFQCGAREAGGGTDVPVHQCGARAAGLGAAGWLLPAAYLWISGLGATAELRAGAGGWRGAGASPDLHCP